MAEILTDEQIEARLERGDPFGHKQVRQIFDSLKVARAKHASCLVAIGNYRKLNLSLEASEATLRRERDALRDLLKRVLEWLPTDEYVGARDVRNEACAALSSLTNSEPQKLADPAVVADPSTINALRSHKWTGLQQGGNPAETGTYEWVRYCSVCGMEDTCEDPLPPCPGFDPVGSFDAGTSAGDAETRGLWRKWPDEESGEYPPDETDVLIYECGGLLGSNHCWEKITVGQVSKQRGTYGPSHAKFWALIDRSDIPHAWDPAALSKFPGDGDRSGQGPGEKP